MQADEWRPNEMDIVLPKDFEAQDAPQVLAQARPVLELPPNANPRVENVAQTKRGTRIDFSYTACILLDNELSAEVAGAQVPVTSYGDLQFNTRGALVAYEVQPADPRQVRAIRDHVSKLIANDRIYFAAQGEKVDPEKLRAQGKDWYVMQDERGNKQLCRVWIS
ncbi:hypothetical protein FBQ82_08380 [Anaerolineae bacterium CFX7]|nr:hypothetical protein [Anaerolineae bacterium CFX7]